MSYQELLKTISPDKPLLAFKNAVLNAPVRHVFIMSTIWYLNKHKKNQDLQIAEVGSWYGASALSFAQGLISHNKAQGSITCIDAWEPFFDLSVDNQETHLAMDAALASDTAYQIFLHNVATLPTSIRCQHMRGQSADILPLLREKFFDVLFIDGDHRYSAVKRDIERALPLVKEGGLICGDDLNLQMHMVDQEYAQQQAESDLSIDPKTQKRFHPGVTVAVDEVFGEVSAWGGFWIMQKQQNKWQKVSFKGMPEEYPKHFSSEKQADARAHFADLIIA